MAGSVARGIGLGRPQSGLPALFAAVMAMTALAPHLAPDPGFHLSATATAGLITFFPRVSMGAWLTSRSALAGTVPVWACESRRGHVSPPRIATTPVMWVTFEQTFVGRPLAYVW